MIQQQMAFLRTFALAIGTALLLCTHLLSAQESSEKDTNITPTNKKPVETITSHAIALRGQPEYSADFTHWRYVNPDAPKGGEMQFATKGTYDNFNRHAQRGSAAANIEALLFDTLMVGNSDEINVYYGLIAESISYKSDFSEVTFTLNPKAQFQDGKPIRAEDVVFSFDKFYDQGVEFFKQFYKGVVAKKTAADKVTFYIPNPSKELMLGLCNLTVFPEHAFKDRDLSQPFREPPLGSGQFKITDYKMGQYVIYERDKNYWATNHPTRKGQNNFDTLRYDYFLDETVLFEAFKKGSYDFRQENIAKNWATQYKGSNFDKQYIVTEEITHQVPQPNQAYVFNIQRPQFKDINVRKALNLLFDYEWTNKNFFYGSYDRNYSYFINSPFSAKGLPTGVELEILTEFTDVLPAELFTQPFALNKTDGSGNIRREIRQALKLFKKAGYSLKNKKLVDKDGKQFEFELLIFQASSERIAIPFQKNIEKIGAKMHIRTLSDSAQYVNRLRERDYDMIISHLGGGVYPSSMALKRAWHTDYIDSTYNAVGTQDPTLDQLIGLIEKHQEDEELLLEYGRAFDRILLWRYYSIPQWHLSKYRIAYWNKFSRPNHSPKYDLGIETWWFDVKKSKKLPEKIR